jgi:RNA polymerase sigma-70 factor (ECF subfamily)
METSLPLTTLESHVASAGPGVARHDELIARIAVGDRLAMAALYARHHVRVYRFLLRFVNDAANAEDLAGDVFLEVWKHAQRFEGRSQVSTWLLAIARYKAISLLRGRINERLDNELLADTPDHADHAETILLRRNAVAAVRQCLTQLSLAHREIIDLVYYHGKTIAEVAEITGAPQNTVKTRMFHARKRLAKLVDAMSLDAVA